MENDSLNLTVPTQFGMFELPAQVLVLACILLTYVFRLTHK